MKYLICSIALSFLIDCNNGIRNDAELDKPLESAKKWFKAWELVSKDVFDLGKTTPTRFVFFDSLYVYTTSELTGSGGDEVTGPQLFGNYQTWFRKKHNGFLTMPDSSQVPVRLMSYAGPNSEETYNAYFVMPLISYWEKEGVDDHGIGIDELTTGVFVHEFSHAQQLSSFEKFGKYFEIYEKKFGTEHFGDDMMQELFENDSLITELYNSELTEFSRAASSSESERVLATKKAIQAFDDKHEFINRKFGKDMKMLDDIWLTLEGVGQYAMYEYFIHPDGGRMSKDKALKAIKTRWWSQEEGFEIVYLLSKYRDSKTWRNDFFGSDMKTVLEVLKKEVEKSTTNR